MTTPSTLGLRAEEIARDLHGDPQLLSGVLSNLISKTAVGQKPAKVTEIADAIRRDTGAKDETAYRMAWQTY